MNITHLIELISRQQPRGERGATAVEYGLMVTLIAVVIIAGVTAFGVEVSKLFLIPADKI